MSSRVRPWFAARYEQTKRLATLVSLGLQSSTVALVAYGLVSWRGVGPWIVPVVFVSVLVLAGFVAWLYYVPLGMRHFERRAMAAMNPTDSFNVTAKEAWLVGRILDVMEGEDSETLRAELEDRAL